MVRKQSRERTIVAPELRDWVDTRLVAGHHRVVRMTAMVLLLNMLLICIAMIGGALANWYLEAAAISMAGAVLHRLWLSEAIARGHNQRPPRAQMDHYALNALWLGLTLAVPLAWWLPLVPRGDQLLLALSGVAQIALVAYTMRTLVKCAIVFIACVTMGLTVGLIQLGGFDAWAAIGVLWVTSTMLIRINFAARGLFVRRIIANRELAAASRTVKLLLNEYEESGSDWLFELDADFCVVAPSMRFAEAAGIPIADLDGRNFADLFSGEADRAAVEAAFAAGQPLRDEVVALVGATHADIRWWSISARPSRSDDGIAYRGVISDVTQQRSAEHRAHRMAFVDTLTSLPNRAHFAETFTAMLAERTADEDAIALLTLDIDHFKTINDVHGHPAGDSYLKRFAERLDAEVRAAIPGDTNYCLARLGSDEFAIALAGPDAHAKGVQLADLLIATMAQPIAIEETELPCAISLGIALAPLHAQTQRHLQSYADIALNAAKKLGRGTWQMFEAGMDAELHARHGLARDLHHAVARGELQLFLQPLVDVASEAKTGYEALLRWNHPVHGLIAPDRFIPVAEETGAIVPIGEWVIREAFAEAARWSGDETIAINLSPLQFASPNLLPVVVNALGDSGLAPHRVEFEITEGVLLHNSEANIELLRRLQALGVKIALDDFGTGYASLNYLLTFPFDKIKIDRSFVSGLATREESRAIVASVITLANQLGMCTLAEGVEHREQLNTLRQQGCRMVQGWLFGRALPSEAYHPQPRREVRARAPRPVTPRVGAPNRTYRKSARG